MYPPHLIQITTAKEHTVNQRGLKLVSSIADYAISVSSVVVSQYGRQLGGQPNSKSVLGRTTFEIFQLYKGCIITDLTIVN